MSWRGCACRRPTKSPRQVAAAPTTDQVPEPLHRANQMYVERFLFEHAARRPNITMRFGWQVDGLRGRRRRRHAERGRASRDGPREALARAISGRLRRRPQPRAPRARHQLSAARPGVEQRYFGGRMFSTYVRAPALYRDVLKQRRAWQYWAVNPEIRSTLISVNGDDEFLFRTRATRPDQPPDDAAVADVMRRCVGAESQLEFIAHEPWTAGMALVAESFGDRPRLACRRRRASVHADRRLRHEHRHRRCRQSGLEARRHGAGLGRRAAARDLRDRAPADRVPQHRHAARQLTVNIGDDRRSIREIERGLAGGRGGAAQAPARCWPASASNSPRSACSSARAMTARRSSPATARRRRQLRQLYADRRSGRPGAASLARRRARNGNSLYDRLGTGFTLLRLGGDAQTPQASPRGGATRHSARRARCRKRRRRAIFISAIWR